MTRLLVLAALSACCHPTRVDRPVVVTPPPCLTRPAPVAPPDAEVCGGAWAAYYVELIAWVLEVESACGGEP